MIGYNKMKSKKEFSRLHIEDYIHQMVTGNTGSFDFMHLELSLHSLYYLIVGVCFPALFWIFFIVACFGLSPFAMALRNDIHIFYFTLYLPTYIGLFLGYFFNIFDKQIEYNISVVMKQHRPGDDVYPSVFEKTGKHLEADAEFLCNYRTSSFLIYATIWPVTFFCYPFYFAFHKIKKALSKIPNINFSLTETIKNKYRKKYIEEFL